MGYIYFVNWYKTLSFRGTQNIMLNLKWSEECWPYLPVHDYEGYRRGLDSPNIQHVSSTVYMVIDDILHGTLGELTHFIALCNKFVLFSLCTLFT